MDLIGIDSAFAADMPTPADQLRERTKQFGFDVIKLVKGLPRNIATECVARQLIRAGTGVPSNYRAACRGRSRREFIARLGVVLEEADEAEFWLEALTVRDLTAGLPVETLFQEASELRAIFWQSVQTARARQSRDT